MHRAWNPQFYERLQSLYPDRYDGVSYEEFFLSCRQNYHAEWPSFLVEPESEAVNVEKTKSEAVIAAAQTFMDKLDPENQMRVIEWAVQNIQENKRIVAHELELDLDDLVDHLKEQAERAQQQNEAGEDEEATGVARKVGKFG